MANETQSLVAFRDAETFVVKGTRDAKQVATAVSKLREMGLNVLTPATFTEEPPADYRLALKVIHAEPRDFFKASNGFAPHGRFLMDLARACGVVWRTDLCRRTDDGSDPYFVEFEAVCIVPDPTTGRPTPWKGTARMDLREGSATSDAQKSDSQRRQKRQFIVELCETRAMLRAIRKATGIRNDYTEAQTKTPFAVVSLEYHPGADSPEARAEIAKAAHRANLSLYYGDLAGHMDTPLPAKQPDPVAELDQVEAHLAESRRDESGAPDLKALAYEPGADDGPPADEDFADFDDEPTPF